MIKTLMALTTQDTDYPPRTARMQWLSSVLNGTMYDGLSYDFGEEKSKLGEYIPLVQRRPSVRYNLSRVIVNESVSMLFSEGHFPRAQSKDVDTAASLEKVIKDSKLNEVMAEAAMFGSVGSVAISFRVLGNRVFFKALPTTFLTPEWNPEAPDQLFSVSEQYKVRGDKLAANGYTIDPDEMNSMFWFRRVWDDTYENWYLPQLCTEQERPNQFTGVGHWLDQIGKDKAKRDGTVPDANDPQVDKDKTVKHGFGFVPLVWVKNLPGGDDVDGQCTFEPAILTQIEIEYQLSQAGRGLKYSSDPMLMIKEPPTNGNSGLNRSLDILEVGKDGDAKMLEISGTAANAVIEYARALREMALEVVGGSRANPDKLSSAQSGRAIEMLNQNLLALCDRLRTSYGEGALLSLLNMVVRAAQMFKLIDKHGRPIGNVSKDAEVSLKWPPAYRPTPTDRQSDAGTLVSLVGANLMSAETAIGVMADEYDIEDIQEELAKIEEAKQASMDKMAALAGKMSDGSDDGVVLPTKKPVSTNDPMTKKPNQGQNDG